MDSWIILANSLLACVIIVRLTGVTSQLYENYQRKSVAALSPIGEYLAFPTFPFGLYYFLVLRAATFAIIADASYLPFSAMGIYQRYVYAPEERRFIVWYFTSLLAAGAVVGALHPWYSILTAHVIGWVSASIGMSLSWLQFAHNWGRRTVEGISLRGVVLRYISGTVGVFAMLTLGVPFQAKVLNVFLFTTQTLLLLQTFYLHYKDLARKRLQRLP